jgi:hypothetical protein
VLISAQATPILANCSAFESRVAHPFRRVPACNTFAREVFFAVDFDVFLHLPRRMKDIAFAFPSEISDLKFEISVARACDLISLLNCILLWVPDPEASGSSPSLPSGTGANVGVPRSTPPLLLRMLYCPGAQPA